MGSDPGRVIVVGLDGLEWRVVDGLLAAGRLPAMRQVLAAGAGWVMRSTTPPLTPAAWSTLFSGLTPAEHGVFDFTARVAGSYRFRLCAAADRQAEMVWRLASESGKRVVVVNVPLTFPATPVNGVMVSGMDAPDLAGAVYPATATAEVLAVSPHYAIDAMSHWYDDSDEFGRQLRGMHEARHRVALELLRRYRPELFICVYVLADRVQHVAWSEPPAAKVVAAYELLDRAIADYLDRLGDRDSLIIVSDHGFQELRSETCVNQILEQAGLLALDGERCQRLLARHNRRALHSRGARATRFESPWHLPPRALWFDGVDWTRTRCAAYGLMGNLMLNLRGRESHGVVQPGADAAAVVRAAAAAVTDGLRGAEVVAHPVSWDHARSRTIDPPDAVLEIDGYRIGTWGGREFFAPDLMHHNLEGHTGAHSPEAVMMAVGRGFTARSDRAGADTLDLTPTLVELLGMRPPTPLAGRSLADSDLS